MDEKDIYEHLEALKSELGTSDGLSELAREKMLGLIDRVEEQLPSAEDPEDNLAEQFEAILTEFEVTHPRLTGIVNNIMVTLGNMGV